MSTDIKVLNIFLDDLNETLFSRLGRAVAHTKSQWLWQHTQKLGMIKADHPSMEGRAAGEMSARKPLMTSWGEGGDESVFCRNAGHWRLPMLQEMVPTPCTYRQH